MSTQNLILELELELSANLDRLAIWHEHMRDLRPHPSQAFNESTLPTLLNNNKVILNDVVATLNQRLKHFDIHLKDPQPQIATMEVDGKTVFAMLLKSLWTIGHRLTNPNQVRSLMPVIPSLIGVVDDYCTYDRKQLLIRAGLQDTYMRLAKMLHLNAYNSLNDFDDTRVERAAKKAKDRVDLLCAELPAGFRDVMAQVGITQAVKADFEQRQASRDSTGTGTTP